MRLPCRLVVTGWDESTQQETVEIVHEALIREWGMLREWIKSNRRFRIWQERLQFEVVKWDKTRNQNYLLSGGNLGEAESWFFDEKYRDYLSDAQRKFIRESLEKREREEKEKLRLQRRAIKWLSGGLFAASLATGFAGLNWVKAEINATQEKLNSSVAISEHYLNLQNYGDAQFEAIKAQQLLDTTLWKQWIPKHIKQKVQVNLYQLIHLRSEAKHTLEGHKSEVYSVKFSPDGKASASDDSTVKLWNWNFDNLLTQGCKKLQGYLIYRPEKLEKLKVCQNSEILTKAAAILVRQGKKLAINGDYKTAVEKFRKAKEWNPKVDIPDYLTVVEQLSKAKKLYPKLDINPEEKAKRNN